MSDERPPRRRSRVPAGRLERLARFGWMAGEFAAGGLVEGTRRFFGGTAADAASALLNPESARRLAQRLARLRGAAMKLGQLLSLESTDILPPEFAEALAVLRASADSMPPAQVRRVLGREYGKGWEARFARLRLGTARGCIDRPGARRDGRRRPPPRAQDPVPGHREEHRQRRRQRRHVAAARTLPARRDRSRRHPRRGQAPAAPGGRLPRRGRAPASLRGAARRRARAAGSARPRRPLDAPRARDGPHRRRADRGARRRRRRAGAPRRRRPRARAARLPRTLRVPLHADRPELRELPDRAGRRIASRCSTSARRASFDPAFCERYARIVRAALAGDRRELRAAADRDRLPAPRTSARTARAASRI